MIKHPIYHEFNLDNMVGNSKPIRITHIEDTNVDVVELCVRQGGSKIDLTGATVTARIVLHAKQDYLINDNVQCTVNDSGNVLIPFDNAVIESQKGVLKIEVNIRRAEDVLTLQFPLWVMVNDTILATAEILPESEGTIPELLEKVKEELERVKDFVTRENVFEILDGALQGNPNTAPTLLIDNTIDQQFNPDGHWIMFYIDSEDVRHNLFDFSNLPSGGISDYTELENKPSINNVTLQGNKTSDDLGLQDKLTAGENVTIDENGVISAEGGTDDYNALKNKPTINGDAISGYIQTSYPYLRYEKIGDRTHYLYIDREKVFQQNPSFSFIHSDYSSSFCGLNPQNRRYPEEYPTDDNGILFGITNSYNDDSYKKTFVEPNYFFFSSTENAIYLRTDHYTYPDDVFVKGEWRKIGGGSQIVSGVVNANGTITFTDSDGNTFTTSGAKLVTSGSEQISMGYDSGGFYFLFDDGQEAS